MATYSQRMPDGRVYTIEGPEGASPQDVQREIAAQHPTSGIPNEFKDRVDPATIDPTKDMGTVERVIAGISSGVAEKRLGVRQLAASATGTEEEQQRLKTEAGNLEKTNAPLRATTAGGVGNFIGTTAPDILGMTLGGGLVRPVVKAISNVGGVVKPLISTLQNALGGAASSVTMPSENYDPVQQAKTGALSSVPGAVTGATAARVVNPAGAKRPDVPQPFLSRPPVGTPPPPIVQERLDAMGPQPGLPGLPGMPALLAENRVLRSESGIPAATNALSQLPFGFGESVKRNREANFGQYTRDRTGAAGHPVDRLTMDAGVELEDKLANRWDRVRSGPPVNLGNVAPSLQPTLDALATQTAFMNRKGPALDIEAAIKSSTQPGTPAVPPSSIVGPNGQPLIPGRPAGPPVPVDIPATTAVDLRSMASQDEFKGATPHDRRAAGAIREVLEDAIDASLTPAQQAEYRALRKAEAESRNIAHAGTTSGGHISPESMLRVLNQNTEGTTSIAPRTPLERRTVAMSHQAPTPSLVDNRSAWVRALMAHAPIGLTVGGGVGGGVLGALSDFGPAGAALGTAGGAVAPLASLTLAKHALGSPAGGRWLTGQAESIPGKVLQSPEVAEFLQRMGISGAADSEKARKYIEDWLKSMQTPQLQEPQQE